MVEIYYNSSDGRACDEFLRTIFFFDRHCGVWTLMSSPQWVTFYLSCLPNFSSNLGQLSACSVLSSDGDILHYKQVSFSSAVLFSLARTDAFILFYFCQLLFQLFINIKREFLSCFCSDDTVFTRIYFEIMCFPMQVENDERCQ